MLAYAAILKVGDGETDSREVSSRLDLMGRRLIVGFLLAKKRNIYIRHVSRKYYMHLPGRPGLPHLIPML